MPPMVPLWSVFELSLNVDPAGEHLFHVEDIGFNLLDLQVVLRDRRGPLLPHVVTGYRANLVIL